ncbi:MAG TPA: hypothetical protein DEV81_15270 [Cyanobacteria bacterium UBA11049]|nr:hypothetical protein [Cyanobacteria bacterium UBA11049]
MRFPASSFLLATLFLTTAVVPAQAVPALPLVGSGLGELIKFFGGNNEAKKEKRRNDAKLKEIEAQIKLEELKTRNNEIKNEKIRSDAKLKEIEAQIKLEELKAKNSADPNLAMIQSWGLKVTTCNDSVVSISMDGKQYCTNPASWLNAGRYQYIRAEDRLEPMHQLSQPLNANTNSQVKPGDSNINANTNSQVKPGDNNINANTNSQVKPGNGNINANTSSQVEPNYDNINANTNSQPQADKDNSL